MSSHLSILKIMIKIKKLDFKLLVKCIENFKYPNNIKKYSRIKIKFWPKQTIKSYVKFLL